MLVPAAQSVLRQSDKWHSDPGAFKTHQVEGGLRKVTQYQ